MKASTRCVHRFFSNENCAKFKRSTKPIKPTLLDPFSIVRLEDESQRFLFDFVGCHHYHSSSSSSLSLYADVARLNHLTISDENKNEQ